MAHKHELKDILAFQQLSRKLDEQEQKELAQKLDIDYQEYKQRIKGKEKETEFLVIMKFLGVLKHLEAYDENFSHITNEFTSDFKIEMPDGYKMLIEIKHTDKDMFEISLGNLQNRINFAERLGLPLRFAISIHGFWGLFTAETLLAKKGKLKINDFGGEKSVSLFDNEFDTCSYLFLKEISIKSVYSHKHQKGMQVFFEPHGELISYEFYYNKKLIFRAKGKNSPFYSHMTFLEAIQDKIANIQQKIEKDGDYTIITEENINGFLYVREIDFILSNISHTQDSNKISYTPTNVINDNLSLVYDKRYIRVILSDLVNLGVDIVVFKDSYGYLFQDFKNQFWKETSINDNSNPQ